MTVPAHDVVVVGAGPAGLFLAALLQRLGVDTVLLEARTDAAPGTRAIGVHPPTLAALEPSGATERLLTGAVRIPRGRARTLDRILGDVRFDLLPVRFPFVAAVPQAVTEAAIAHGGPAPRRGARVKALRDRGDRVEIAADGLAGILTARMVVVAAGRAGRMLVPAVSITDKTYADRYLMADVAGPVAEPDDVATVTLDPDGVLESFPLPGGGRRLVAWVGRMPPGADPETTTSDPARRLQDAVSARGAPDLAARIARVSAFGIRRALARRMRVGRILLIGDTAHEISPIGGQGMNLGLLDAAALAPLLADAVRGGRAAEALARWECDRLASARTAARIASLNTALGRAHPTVVHAGMAALLRGALAGPAAPVLARAYAMGFDRGISAPTSRSRAGRPAAAPPA
ncbi:NAD(P)-binding protein [Microbacterium sp. SYP-A9085]|uniref:FAD-dependent oxidoreductase n=1 Tax=Microbacterium sp. SYP-A9085 TaxID=2664454 RepID=UPI00129C104B|nr:NAD(P)/FAD-dependent oxidoreductase [Microbacterium sp. SYP-A9085]MRH29396.1 NAD(P)-binding protein [Microbacterium sp. SYP-A9085]